MSVNCPVRGGNDRLPCSDRCQIGVGGSIRFEGSDLLERTEVEMESIRGNDISMIFQEPMTSLNPLFTVGRQIAEAIALHQPELTKRRGTGELGTGSASPQAPICCG